jgi:phospholipid/cholesterol/gamma-HCH transport system substrate-binding protein
VTIARGAAFGALIAAVIAVALLIFGMGGGTEYVVRLPTANQLVKGNEVKVGGLPVGKITEIKLADDNQADIKIEVNDEFAPLHEGTTALIRQTSLPSVANRYIALTPGPNNAPELPEGGVLGIDRTTATVDLDQLFNALDPSTRKGLQKVLQGFATWYAGQSDNIADSYKYLGPSLTSVAEVMDEISRDQETFTKLIITGASATGAIAERRDDLAELVSNGNAFARAIGLENESFDRALAAFPQVLEQGAVTFKNLQPTLDDLDRLTTASLPATKNLAPFLRELAQLTHTLRPAFKDLHALVRNPGKANDATDLMRIQPRVTKVARTNTINSVKALKRGQPVIEFIRPYAPEISAWITHFAQVPAYYDANGHYARVLPIFNAFSYDQANNVLNSLPPAQRNSIITALGNKYCPGNSTQPAPDGSNPFLDHGKLGPEDCDPNVRPPGP